MQPPEQLPNGLSATGHMGRIWVIKLKQTSQKEASLLGPNPKALTLTLFLPRTRGWGMAESFSGASLKGIQRELGQM